MVRTSRALARYCPWQPAAGAAPTPHGSHIATLAIGKAADLVLIDWDKLAYPISTRKPRRSTWLFGAPRATGVYLVMVAGEVVYKDGRFTRVNRDAALRELHDSLQHVLADDEIERRALSKTLLPHVRRFYAGYFDSETHVPRYRPSSRV
jgi:hypothetical protein